MDFLGKWSCEQSSMYVTLDLDSKQLNISGADEGAEQRFNAYGTDEQFILQGPNGKYVVWSGSQYEANLERDGELSYFALEASGNDFRIVDLGIKGAGGTQYYWDNQSEALLRVEKSASPATTTVFTKFVITLGLKDMLSHGFESIRPDLTWVYLVDANLSSMMDFSQVNATNANFAGINLSNVNMSSVNFTNAIVTNAKMTGQGADLSSAILTNADFTGTNMKYATLFGVDFTGANMSQVDMTSTSLSRPDFTDTNLTDVKMSNPTSAGGSIDLMQMKFSVNTNFNGCQMRNTFLKGFDFSKVVFTHADLTGCKMDNTKLDGAEFSYANLTDVSLTGNISMIGTNFSNATLTKANMTGAQMGSIGLRFRISEQAEFDQFKIALENGDVNTVKTIFNENGYPLTDPVSITESPSAPGRVWDVRSGDNVTYTVRLEAVGNSESLAVYQIVVAAVLVNAFMKGTILTSANLFNVRASGVQLYGGAKLDGGAILEGAQFDNANMSDINLKQAQLYGVNLNYTILTGAEFQGAKLEPSATGGAVSLVRASLQGANFSGAALKDAIITDAAVSVNDEVETDLLNGVWLYDTPQTTNLVDELNEGINSFELPTVLLPYLHSGLVTIQIIAGFAANGVTITEHAIVSVLEYGPYWQVTDGNDDYVIFHSCDSSLYQPALGVAHGTDDTQTPAFYMPLYLQNQLQTGSVSEDVSAEFAKNGITLSSSARVEAKQQETDWLLTDISSSYNLWRGLSKMCQLSLTVRPAVPGVLALFSSHSMPLTSRITISSRKPGRWTIDNDSNNPFNPIVNYIKFNMVEQTSDPDINIFGMMMRVVRLSSQNVLEYENIICDVTVLPEESLQPTTICPNSIRYDVNANAGTSYNEWMQAKELPQAPYCIPSADGTYYCPAKPPSGFFKAKE